MTAPVHRNRRRHRRGSQAIELMLAFLVTFVFAIGLYVIGQIAFGNLYQVIASLVGSPYA